MSMPDIDPVVRQMLLCDEVQVDPDKPHKVNLFGLISTVRADVGEDFPLRLSELCVYLLLSEVRGEGVGRIIGIDAETEKAVFATKGRQIRQGPSPLHVQGCVFRIRNTILPRPTLYLVQFRYNDRVLAQQPLLVR
jgi:hypothetical protein